jgi:predicted site-specific integrase-resolvase
MDDWQPMQQAAIAAGVSRHSVSRWVRNGLLKSRKGRVRNLNATLVKVAAVRELAKTRKRGRPKGKANRVSRCERPAIRLSANEQVNYVLHDLPSPLHGRRR